MRTMWKATWTRRNFVRGLSALAGSAGILGGSPRLAAADPPPETTRLRLVQTRSICQAPQYVAEQLLRAEGFADIEYVKKPGATKGIEAALASGEADINVHFAGPLIMRVDAGDPVVILAGAHVGCFELFATEQIRGIRDLKGKTVAVLEIGSSQHVFLSSMLAYVGLDPRRDVRIETHPSADSMQLLSDGKIDAFIAFPPEPQELRARRIGHVIVNSIQDRPWSHYFCCMIAANRQFVERHPIATKRALRAILKATDFCAAEPARSAQFLVDRGFTSRYDYALQMVNDIPYGRWRELDPEDTARFYALQLREVGMIQSTPKKIVAEGTDWRFLNELRQELKG